MQRQINERSRARAKKVVVSELHEIALVASLGQINNIGSDRVRKFKMECSQVQWQIKESERAREKCWSHRIARNRSSSIIRPNK